MSLLISRTRGLVAILAAAALIIVPVKLSAAKADPFTDTSLNVFTVNGTSVSDDQTVTLPSNTSTVDVVAQTSNPDATRTISGDTGLSSGNNPLIVSVTAADGTTTENHQVNLYVSPASSNTSLSVFKVNGTDVADGQDVFLEPLTTSVTVDVVTADADATYEVTGATGLVTGDNSLKITVTAPDLTVDIYNVNLNVAPNTDTDLSKFQINGENVIDGDSIDVAPYTTEVQVAVETVDPDATYLVSGDTDLEAGENTLIVTVVAADAVTATDYTVIVNVLLGNNTEVDTLQVNGDDVSDGATVELAPYTTEVQVDVVTTDPDATFEVTGDTDLAYGDNTLLVTVTAADGITSEDYVINLSVPLGDSTELSVFQIEGTDVFDGDSVDLDEGTTEVEVTAETLDPDASVEYSGNTGLVSGENTLTVTVTAADGTSQDYTITLNVALSSDTTLSTLQVNGTDLVDGESIDIASYTTEVEVTVVTNNPNATFEIEGATDLQPGDNDLVITVTAEDESTTQQYTITLRVAFGDNTNVTSLQVNGNDVADGDSLDLDPYTTEVEVTVETLDPEATFVVTGATDLVAGENILTVTVTAADNYTSQDYVIILNVALGNNVELATFQVNGSDVQDGDSVDLDPYTTEVEVVAETADPNATVEIIGTSDLIPGDNLLVVTVVAEDGSSAEYDVVLKVALGNNVELATFQVDGSDVQDGDSVDLEPYTSEVDVVVETLDVDASFEVEGGTDLQPGENTLTVTVTAADGETTQVYTVILVVALGDSTELAVFQVNGEDVSDGDVVDLAPYTSSVEVVVVAVDPDATVEVEGDSDLVVGLNDLVVTVTAVNGDVRHHHH
ncbi:MAG: hypothetical protein EBZ41_03550 [Actinobacteria bacterium]|nr:hypothetical protein [Actinomycetota bacterium]